MDESNKQIATTRYVSKCEADKWCVEVSFTASDELGQGNPANTNVRSRCLKKRNVYNWDDTCVECWSRDFGDLNMPGGAWNGVRLVEIKKNRVFLGVSNKLYEVSAETGDTLWELQICDTPIRNLLASKANNSIIVFCSYYTTSSIEHEVNIAAIDLSGNIRWRAKSPGADDSFANPPYYENGKLKAVSFCGYLCTIDESNGDIVERVFVK